MFTSWALCALLQAADSARKPSAGRGWNFTEWVELEAEVYRQTQQEGGPYGRYVSGITSTRKCPSKYVRVLTLSECKTAGKELKFHMDYVEMYLSSPDYHAGCWMLSGYVFFNHDSSDKISGRSGPRGKSGLCVQDAITRTGITHTLECPSGYERVRAKSACRSAVEELGFVWEEVASPTYPSGCFNIHTQGFFNNGGSDEAMTDVSPICLQGAITRTGIRGTLECPSGYERVLSKSACTLAMKELGFLEPSASGWENPVREMERPNYPSGCFSTYNKGDSERPYFNHDGSDNPHSNASTICVPIPQQVISAHD